ncbi:hypothetical protein EV356DRAFT_509402 [Viridothelium virens]|uniref:Uncharacterized protein n=1 Tax=Viridothelium virens TaxID=1048519 RepID=A0A6A6GWZ2_VIRVR|nr:hypothetical protein EV356DRAFT_509402 [Viridothelium virens]
MKGFFLGAGHPSRVRVQIQMLLWELIDLLRKIVVFVLSISATFQVLTIYQNYQVHWK